MIRQGGQMSTMQQLRLTAILSAPAILAQLSNILMEYIDAAMVGNLGTNASASIGLMATSTWLFWGLCSSVAAGFSVQVANRIGANDMDGAKSILKQSILPVMAFSLLLSIIGLSISWRLPYWLGASSEVAGQASAYFAVFAASLPAFQLSMLSGAMLRCSGNTLFPGLINVGTCFLDVIFNALLIFPTREIQIFGMAFNIPGAGMGVTGAALGTAIASATAGIVMTAYLLRWNPGLNLKGFRGSAKLSKDNLGRAARISSPLAVEHCVLNGAQIVTTIIVAPLGPVAIAANAFAVTAESLCYMPGFGIREAATTLTGQSLGAGRRPLSRKFANITVISGIVIMTLCAILMYIGAPVLMDIITPVQDIRNLGVEVLRIEAFAEPMYAASIVAYGVFVGAGDTLIPCVMNLGSIWAVRITLAAILAPTLGLHGVWVAMAVELIFRGIIFLIRLRGEGWMQANKKLFTSK